MELAYRSVMFKTWRSEIDKGRQRAIELTDDMRELVVRGLIEALVFGIVIGSVIGGFLVWLMMK